MFRHLISYLVFARVILAECYDIHGNLATDTDYKPCNSILGTISMCCATNRGSSSVYTPDTCLPNGLCQNVFTNKTTNKPDTDYWREDCSDTGWSSRYCLPAICNSSSEVSSMGHAEMTPCDNTATSAKWCCGLHNTACCGTGQEIILAAVLGGTTESSSTAERGTPSSTTTAAPQSGPTSTPTSSSSSTAALASTLSTGGKAGIGIGCAALAVLILGVILFFYNKSKKSPIDGLAPGIGFGRFQNERESESHGHGILQHEHPREVQRYERRMELP